VIEPLQARDVRAAASVLARAFRDNPGMCGLLRGDPAETRLRVLQRCMLGFAEAVRRHGVAEVVKERAEISAVSLAFPPGGYPPPLRAELMIAAGPLLSGPRRVLRFARAHDQIHQRHPRYPHWYLWMLGVEPERQGQGLGSALLKSLSARADSERAPCYLETDRASAVRLYERHGYAVLSDEVLPALDARFWFMRRGPSA